MVSFTNVTGLGSTVTLLMASLLLLPGIGRLTQRQLALLLSAIVIVALLPFQGLPLAAYVRGAIGDLSITTMVLLLHTLLRPLFGWPPVDVRTSFVLQVLVALAASVLYPLALGIGPFDPYRLGYGDAWFLGALLLIALVSWLVWLPLIALCIAFAVLAWAVDWYESNNLWDYLLDPLVSSYALSALVLRGAKTLLKLYRASNVTACIMAPADSPNTPAPKFMYSQKGSFEAAVESDLAVGIGSSGAKRRACACSYEHFKRGSRPS
jgi:hypothetical protein